MHKLSDSSEIMVPICGISLDKMNKLNCFNTLLFNSPKNETMRYIFLSGKGTQSTKDCTVAEVDRQWEGSDPLRSG